MSKFPLPILERAVFPFVQSDDPDVILGAAFGEDVALTNVGGEILISHVDPIVGAIGNIGWLAVHVTCNDISSGNREMINTILVPLDRSKLAECVLPHVVAFASAFHASVTLLHVLDSNRRNGRQIPFRYRYGGLKHRVIWMRYRRAW